MTLEDLLHIHYIYRVYFQFYFLLDKKLNVLVEGLSLALQVFVSADE